VNETPPCPVASPCTYVDKPKSTGLSQSMWMDKMRAVSPKKGLSHSEANDNRDDESDLKRPGKSRKRVNWLTLEDARDNSHNCKHEKDVDAGERSLCDTTRDVVCKNKGRC
jgi:hypothetical protein